MKTLIMLVALLICWTLPLSAEEISLEGNGVIHYKYPENFQESNRYIRKGITTKDGDCEFNYTMRRLKPGERIFTKAIAYNPYTCESLIIEGLYTVEPQKKNDRTTEYTVATKHFAAAADSAWTVHAYLRTWYDDPVYLDVNSVTSEIWWDPTSSCASGNYFSPCRLG